MRKKLLIGILAAALVVVAVPGVYIAQLLWRHDVFKTPTYDPAPVALPDLGPAPRVLLFTKTNGYRHIEGIPASIAMFEGLAKELGWSLYHTEDAGVHTPENLAQFDLLVWSNVSGDVLTEDQRAAFRGYIEGGGEVLGIHATGGDPSYVWPWYPQEFIRAQFRGHPGFPQFQQADVVVEDRDHPAMKHLDERWKFRDELYSFVASPRERVHVLASLDESTYSPNLVGPFGSLSMGDHPIIWWHELGEGTVFYSALGHLPETYSNPEYREVLKQACLWLMQRGAAKPAPEEAPAAN
ncbi:MAG: ThuA domain-containing protein [Candidatus Hydrogenedens sp.]|nr:ThuA domain-containing protein [Candidatus Hydrogenedens sp.]